MTESANTTTILAMETGDDNGNGDNASKDDQSRYDAIEEELRNLSDWHRMRERCGLEEDESGCTVKKKPGRTRTLKPKHLEDFSDDDYREAFCKGKEQRNNNTTNDSESFRRFRIFNQFARSVCHTNAIARKEIFEAWAMALYVHETFLSTGAMARRRRKVPIKRFADLVCSHGLLSWALLLLASSDEEPEADTKQQTQHRSMTAVCVDIAMPKSSETAAGIFFKEFPQFGDNASSSESSSESSSSLPQQTKDPRWDYVEGPVENLVPHESTLLVGIHACGRLSDIVIAQAISSNAPLALIPCCHSKKILTPEQKNSFKIYAASQCVPITTTTTHSNAPASYSIVDTLADFMDSIRIQRLINAGYDVREVWIPKEFTLKNRIILAIPPLHPTAAASEASAQLPGCKRRNNNWGVQYFPIPLEDSPKARAEIRSIAGRAPAIERYVEAHPPPAIAVSVWLPNPDGATKQDPVTTGKEKEANDEFTAEALQMIIDQTNPHPDLDSRVKVVDATHKFYRSIKDGRISKTLKVHYLDCRNNKAKAKKLHKTLKEVTIPMHFPTITVA